jgi:putative intracellular protease/amidase
MYMHDMHKLPCCDYDTLFPVPSVHPHPVGDELAVIHFIGTVVTAVCDLFGVSVIAHLLVSKHSCCINEAFEKVPNPVKVAIPTIRSPHMQSELIADRRLSAFTRPSMQWQQRSLCLPLVWTCRSWSGMR